jgi:hypothetical protein
METAGWSKCFLLARGSWLLVSAAAGVSYGEELLQAVPPRNVIDTVVRLRKRERTATLRLVLQYGDEQAIDDIDVHLYQTRLGEPGDYEMAIERTGRGFLCRWAPGRYRAEVVPKNKVVDYGWFAKFEQDVELRDGAETVLERTLEPFGRVRFQVHLPDPADRRRIEDFAIWTMVDGEWQRGLRNFVHQRADAWVSGAWVLAGQPITWKTLLPPGRHELGVRSRDYKDTVIGVTISPRTVTDVDVWLQPR